MKDHNLIALAVPVFLAMIALELLADRLRGEDSFELGDSVSNLGCGVLNQLFAVVFASVFAAAYLRLHRLAPLPLAADSFAAWAVAFVGVDFAYYWWHRLSHQVNFLWAVHVVHHQSRRYNLTVALRQAAFSMATAWVFYLPLALLGVPPAVTLAMSSLSTIYQFWIHTRAIGKLGAFELLFNTPSHHRVHHAVNAKYIDKNYGAILINWDRLFGTFQEEEEEPTYGITSPFSSLDPVWANFHYWADLVALSRQAGSWKDAAKVWLMYPGWKPAGAPAVPKEAGEAPAAGPEGRPAALKLAAAIAGLVLLYGVSPSTPWALKAAWAGGVAALVFSLGRTLDAEPSR